ncbi:glyoxalase/bleomycin resistance/extradiol dioxygenase family protein [Aliidiomarina minuta]|uniref:Glyoxalase/bleomycin resistance/extradiol dioxygenase family protein n=1 Tax=Aliidiomarina minuta TaxID=880057 RepID=A0A432W4D0_9GAMM|nr:VOC family protein [Aliidiomarina minuta]RUO24361.1 glyoxalase/bleomycin resistance/extradiol dioxygenase family protein [Aliidiomarina minuta]
MKFWSGVVTAKVQESKDFYVRLFGCEVLYEGDDGWFVLLQLGDSELGFMKPGMSSQSNRFRAPYQGAGMWISVDVEDVDAEYARIKNLGVPVEVELRDEPWGDRHFVVVDPNGIGVDVVEHRQ